MNALILSLLTAGFQESPKPKQPWLGHKEGAWIKVTETTQASGGKARTVEKKITIVKVDGRNVTISEQKTVDGEKGPEMEKAIIAEEKETAPPGEKEDLGKEKIKVGTRAFDCDTVEYVQDDGNCKLTTRIWTAKGAPGTGLVKKLVRRVDKAAGATTVTTQLVKADDTIKTGSKSVRGWEVEVIDESRNTKITTKSWYSEQIPGWLVRQESKSENQSGPGAATTTKFEVVDFDLKK